MLILLISSVIYNTFNIESYTSIEFFFLMSILFYIMLSIASLFGIKRNDRHKSVWLAVIFAGAPQIAHNQWKLGTVLYMMNLFWISNAKFMGFEKHENFMGAAILTLVSGFLAYIMADGLNEKKINETYQKEAVDKYKTIVPLLKKGITPALDTNILMHEPLMLIAYLRDTNAPLVISKQVFNELDGLKKNSSATKKRAQLAFDLLEVFQANNRLGLLDIPSRNQLEKYHLAHSNDDKIIGSYLLAMDKHKTKLAFLSNDKGARIIGRQVNIPIVGEGGY